jgi:hypothetical protein
MSDDDAYMKDPEAKTLRGMIRALTILAKYNSEQFFSGAEHDIFYVYVPWDNLTTDEQRELSTLGWHKNEDEGGDCGYYT